MIERFCCFCKSYFQVEWNRLTLFIFALPFVLFFIIVHLMAVILSDNNGTLISNTEHCMEIGRDVLADDGSAVDAAIAMMICEEVHDPEVIGLGGGFTALLYMNGRIESLTATTMTPEKATVDLLNRGKRLPLAALSGVPGELLGYWEMHRKYGLLPWKRLIMPSVNICKNGIDVHELPYLFVHKDRRRRNVLSKANKFQMIDGYLKFPILGRTLHIIADKGADAFYNGELGEALVQDIQQDGGLITMHDLRNYSVSWSTDVISFNLPNKYKVFTTPLPSSGFIVALAMNIIKGWQALDTPVYWHRVVEATKHALGLGNTLADYEHEPNATIVEHIKATYARMLEQDFAREIRGKIFDAHILNDTDYGGNYQHYSHHTASALHVAVLAPNGDSIALTSSQKSSANYLYYSIRTGIYMNDQLRSYRLPSKEQIPPGYRASPWRRFLMPHAPVMVFPLYKAVPRFMLGALGSQNMPAQIVSALTKICLLHKSAEDTINSGYLLANVAKGWVEYDEDNPVSVINYLKQVGHKLQFLGDRLRPFGTVAIVNINNMPISFVPTHKIYDHVDVHPTITMGTLFLIMHIIIDIALLLVMISDYCKIENLYSIDSE